VIGVHLTLLGTGDAIGTPKVGCTCETCTRARRDGIQRLRTSLLVEHGGRHLLIDSSPDLRMQLLASGSPHIDAVIWTHGHYDHFVGYNEFYRVQSMPPVYAALPVLDYCRMHLHFLRYGEHPIPVYEPFELFGLKITLFEVTHPPIYATGVAIEHDGVKIAHTGDTNPHIPEQSLAVMQDPDLLFVDAIVPPGITIGKHMNYGDACALAGRLGAADFRCVHMSHLVPWDAPHIGLDGEVFPF
jgi:phosphoribosyl 1,2-cyclic phosphate phosphodiesterase